jgi:ribose transport system substrate-binding protein
MAREQGFAEEMARHGGIRIVDKRHGDSDFAKSMRVAENLLTAWPTLRALFASNETGSVGSAQAIKSRQSRIHLVGFDSGPVLEAELRARVIDALVVQHPFRMGYDAVVTAAKKLRGETVERIQHIPPQLVTLANVDQPEIREQMNPDLKRYLG